MSAGKRAAVFLIIMCLFTVNHANSQSDAITRIATDLENPRGVAVLPDGRLLVAEAGTGFVPDNPAENTGRLSVFEDVNADGDYDDAGERTAVLARLPGYNIMYHFNPGRDEIVGIGDVLSLADGRIFFTLDDNFQTLSVVELTPNFEPVGNLLESAGSLNSIAYDAESSVIYVAESTLNALTAVTLDGETRRVVGFDMLASNQQAVPSGVAVDPLTGDVLVALFSGQLWDYYDSILSFMPGDAKIVRVDPATGRYEDEITGLTTAVDVAVDEAGNLYVVELTTRWPTPLLTHEFDLFDPNGPPDAGGYARFSGRVTLYPSDASAPVVLADDLDTPTNITYDSGFLYVSTGMGTPGRPIWGPNGRTRIVGEIYRIAVGG